MCDPADLDRSHERGRHLIPGGQQNLHQPPTLLLVPAGEQGAAGLRRFKISFELPQNWTCEVQGGNYVFSGPKGTEAFYATVVFQFITREKRATLASQVKGIKEQIAGNPGGAVMEKVRLTVAGQPAMRVRSRFTQRNEPFQQEMHIVERSGYFYWIGYTVNPRIYARSYPVYAGVIKGLRFTR